MKTETVTINAKTWVDAFKIVSYIHGHKKLADLGFINREAEKLYQDEINYKSRQGELL